MGNGTETTRVINGIREPKIKQKTTQVLRDNRKLLLCSGNIFKNARVRVKEAHKLCQNTCLLEIENMQDRGRVMQYYKMKLNKTLKTQ